MLLSSVWFWFLEFGLVRAWFRFLVIPFGFCFFFCAKLTLFREGVELFKKRLVHHQERTCRIQFLLL